jgi:hypothetical protein
MTNLLKALLHDYGVLEVSLSKLEAERPGNPHASLNTYCESMGTPYEGPAGVMLEKLAALGSNEHAIVMRISPDGSTNVRGFDRNDNAPATPEERSGPRIAVWELPEDEFYYFKAFREGLFDLEKSTPPLAPDGIRARVHTVRGLPQERPGTLTPGTPPANWQQQTDGLWSHLRQCLKRKIMARIIDRELSQLMYESIEALLDKMRNNYGFRDLAPTHDREIRRLSLIRNCLMHNAGKVNDKLADVETTMIEGQPVTIHRDTISEANASTAKCA